MMLLLSKLHFSPVLATDRTANTVTGTATEPGNASRKAKIEKICYKSVSTAKKH